MAAADGAEGQEEAPGPEPRLDSITPLYWAIHQSRYQRRAMIEQIQKKTQRELIIYVTDPTAEEGINPDDIAPFEDLMRSVKGPEIDFILNSNGGSIDTAEKLLFMCRNKAKHLRVIVPERAKSAATLIALGSDEIVMSVISELGPTDPQIKIPEQGGGHTWMPAHSIREGLEKVKEEIKNDPDMYIVYAPLLDHLNVGLLDMCDRAIAASERFAIKWLQKHMLKDNPTKAEEVTEYLCGTERFLHSEVIDAVKADEIGLQVLNLPPEDQLWDMLWRLYCVHLADMRREGLCKIFESRHASIPITR
jgi:hypothetical protein